MNKESAIYWVRTKVSKEELEMVKRGEEYTDTFEHKGKTVVLHMCRDDDNSEKVEVMFSTRGEPDHHFSLTFKEIGLGSK